MSFIHAPPRAATIAANFGISRLPKLRKYAGGPIEALRRLRFGPPLRRGPDARQRRVDQEENPRGHPGPSDGDRAANADPLGDGGRYKGADRITDAVRDH